MGIMMPVQGHRVDRFWRGKVMEEMWAAENIHQFMDTGMVMWEYTDVKIHQIKT